MSGHELFAGAMLTLAALTATALAFPTLVLLWTLRPVGPRGQA